MIIPLNSGQILVSGSNFYCGSSTSGLCQLALKSDIPAAYTHPTTKQCNYFYTHPSTIQCSAATEINNLKSSVSSGKTQVANAITGKGVSASQNDSFATLASKITQIGSTGLTYKLLSGASIVEASGWDAYDGTNSVSIVSAPPMYGWNRGSAVLTSGQMWNRNDSGGELDYRRVRWNCPRDTWYYDSGTIAAIIFRPAVTNSNPMQAVGTVAPTGAKAMTVTGYQITQTTPITNELHGASGYELTFNITASLNTSYIADTTYEGKWTISFSNTNPNDGAARSGFIIKVRIYTATLRLLINGSYVTVNLTAPEFIRKLI